MLLSLSRMCTNFEMYVRMYVLHVSVRYHVSQPLRHRPYVTSHGALFLQCPQFSKHLIPNVPFAQSTEITSNEEDLFENVFSLLN